MNYENNKIFIEEYYKRVLFNLMPIIKDLSKELKPTVTEKKSIHYYCIKPYYTTKMETIEVVRTTFPIIYEPYYTDEELFEIVKKYVNIDELETFLNILRKKWWFVIHLCTISYDEKDSIIKYKNMHNYLMNTFEEKYDIYKLEQKRRLRNIERKNKKNLKKHLKNIF